MSSDISGALAPIRAYRPTPWEQIPDFGLYMDQVVTFIARIYAPLYGDDIHGFLSPSMINNYVKGGLIPRPVGKKYSREQIALLTIIVALKQTSSMEDIKTMLTGGEGAGVEALYEAFNRRFGHVIHSLCGEGDAMPAPASALDFAILASAYSVCCAAALRSGKTVQ